MFCSCQCTSLALLFVKFFSECFLLLDAMQLIFKKGSKDKMILQNLQYKEWRNLVKEWEEIHFYYHQWSFMMLTNHRLDSEIQVICATILPSPLSYFSGNGGQLPVSSTV